jgi:hypothetical protein
LTTLGLPSAALRLSSSVQPATAPTQPLTIYEIKHDYCNRSSKDLSVMAGTSPVHGEADKHKSRNNDEAVEGSLSKGDVQRVTASQGKNDKKVDSNQDIE